MNHIERVFGKPRVLLPVIHVQSIEQAQHNAKVAMENGADGVFLINQGSGAETTFRAAQEVSALHPKFWVGINLLGERDLQVLSLVEHSTIRGVWSDDAGISEETTSEDACALRDRLLGVMGSWSTRGGSYLSGVAFKYRRSVDPRHWGHVAAMAAKAGVDVVTTSGQATGSAAPQEKLEAMREALGDHALALASGVSEENVDQYPRVNAFIVASSILLPGPGDNFDPVRIRRLASRLSA